MTQTLYQKGVRFENRVKKYLESVGYYVIRQGKSAFPDLIAVMTANYVPFNSEEGKVDSVTPVRFFECKNWAKVPSNPILQLSKEEIQKFKNMKQLMPLARCFLAYNDIPKGKKYGKIRIVEVF